MLLLVYGIACSGIRFQFPAETRTYFLHSVQTASGEPNKLLCNAFQDLILGEKLSDLEANPTPQPSGDVYQCCTARYMINLLATDFFFKF